MDLLARAFTVPWLVVIGVAAAAAVVKGHLDLAVLLGVGLPLARVGFLLWVSQGQARHYAGLAGDPSIAHRDWVYVGAETPVTDRFGIRCARCGRLIRRGEAYLVGAGRLMRRPRIGQPSNLGRISKDTPLYGVWSYCRECGAIVGATGRHGPLERDAVQIPVRTVPTTIPSSLLLGGGAAGGLLVAFIVFRPADCSGPACPCLDRWNSSGAHTALTLLPAATSARVGPFRGPPTHLRDALGATHPVADGTCLVVSAWQFAQTDGAWFQGVLDVRPVGDLMDATIVRDGTLRPSS